MRMNAVDRVISLEQPTNAISVKVSDCIHFINSTVANDYGRIKLMGTSNAGELEIATADDGTEPIYVRQYTGTFTTVKRTLTLLDASGNTAFPGSITVNGNIRSGGGGCSITTPRLLLLADANTPRQPLMLYQSTGGALNLRDDNASPAKYVTLYGGSQTVTHVTNSCGEPGTFCESTGKIYDGYDRITNTDCICAVQQASSLTKKIVGIITADNEFASHGDVLVKVVPGEYEIGDILAPDENGYGRLATDEELMFMMMHAIPRPKITSLETGIENTVATFLI